MLVLHAVFCTHTSPYLLISEFNLTDYEVPLSVSFTVINTKEPAYEANLYIIHPLALSYVGADKETVLFTKLIQLIHHLCIYMQFSE